jgi:hypothetical protein
MSKYKTFSTDPLSNLRANTPFFRVPRTARVLKADSISYGNNFIILMEAMTRDDKVKNTAIIYNSTSEASILTLSATQDVMFADDVYNNAVKFVTP